MATNAQAAPLPQGANITAAKQAVFDQAREIGRVYGRGKTARIKLAELAVNRSASDEIDVGDAERMWQETMQGSGEETKLIGGDDPKDTKQRASDLKHFIVLGSNKELSGPSMFDNALQRMAALRSSGAVKNARVWELMLAFARKQNKEPQRELTSAEIDKVMEDKANPPTDFIEKIDASRRALLAANEGQDEPKVYEAINLIEEVVKAAGGTRKQRQEEARKKAKEILDAAKAPLAPKGKGKNKGKNHANTQP